MSETDSLDAFLKRYPYDEKDPDHTHPASDIEGPLGNTRLVGDLWSFDWDGAVPADLSAGRDTTATRGFYLDASAGVGQFMGLYWAAGSVSPLATAETWLADSGWVLPTSQAQIASTLVSRGIVAYSNYLVDMTVTLQVSGIAAGRDWWAQCEAQGIVRGLALFGARVASSSVSVSSSGSGSVSGTTGWASANHTHGAGNLETGTESANHTHGAGTLATDTSGASYSGYESSHYHSGPSHFHDISGYSGNYTGTPYHNHSSGSYVTGYAGTGSTGAGSSHRHSTPDHAHDVTGTTAGVSANHNHAVTGQTAGVSADHNHTFSGSVSVTCTGSGTCSAGLARGQVTLRWIGTVTADSAGQIELGVQAATQVSAATVDRVQIAYMIWNAPVPPQVELLLAQTLTMYAPEVSNAA